jgi:ABC-type transporter Mla subunit MlaD
VKRIAVIAAVLIAAGVVATLGTGAGGRAISYRVRAIFDNAVSAIPGEDVKIAGVKVGTIDSLDVTPDKRAAIVLDVNRAGFQDFRTDATCTIRPQSLIGEKFVECVPTQPRPVGAPAAPSLPVIRHGPGTGQHLLPVSRTSSPVDVDLIADILREPYRQRLSIILDELGTGVAGNGAALNATIRRADPALAQTDRVLALLASQNRVLANLARDSDTVLAPLARERRRVADQFAQVNTVATATAERGADLERVLQRLPGFLRQLRPTMDRLGALSDQATPVVSDLGSQAPAIDALIRQLGPFSRAALPALRTLGQAAAIGGPALVKSRPTIRALRAFATDAQPAAANASALLASLRRSGGIERLLDYVFYQVAAVNGFDQFGHYLRAALIVNLCTTYATTPAAGCSANFSRGAVSASVRTAAARRRLLAAAAALAGHAPVSAGARAPGSASVRARAHARRAPVRVGRIELPGALDGLLSGGALAPAGTSAAAGPVSPAAPAAPGSAPAAPDPRAGLLDYLLGPAS